MEVAKAKNYAKPTFIHPSEKFEGKSAEVTKSKLVRRAAGKKLEPIWPPKLPNMSKDPFLVSSGHVKHNIGCQESPHVTMTNNQEQIS